MKGIAIIKPGTEEESENETPAGEAIEHEPGGLGVVRIPLSQLPPGIVAGATGTASFRVAEVDDEGAEIQIEAIDNANAPESSDQPTTEPDYEASMNEFYKPKK